MASCHCQLTSLRSLEVHVYYQLRQLRRQAVRSLSEDASKTLIQAFVFCRLNYCNSLFFGMYLERTGEPVAVGSERRRQSGY